MNLFSLDLDEYQGWFLDLYADAEKGVIIWFLGSDGRRYRFWQPFAVTFYAAGPFVRLRAAWRYLREHQCVSQLRRERRTDLFVGALDVLAVEVPAPLAQQALFRDLLRRFPDLDYYDADVPLLLRYTAVTQTFPLAYCRIIVDDNNQIHNIEPLESRWELQPTQPPLRIMRIEPDSDPAHTPPQALHISVGKKQTQIDLTPHRWLLLRLNAALKRHDPDIILTRWGDTWLLPHLLELCATEEATYLNLNRDQSRQALLRKEMSYATYGQVMHRGRQVHLFGRWHIDRTNAMLYGEYGLEGVFEQARVTGLPVQEIARKSPGAGITAMQMQTALQRGVLIPHQKQQAERFKSARDLIRADRGGMVYQPLVGLHTDVAEIDFVSMYPSIMVHFNLSPETVGQLSADMDHVPELDVPVDRRHEGLVPATLRPMLRKRVALKQRLATLTHRDCRYVALKARAAALKWLLVVCFGYLGYKNARFGRIESHEAVTAYGREALLRAKETAESMGFRVLHMYVDGLWVQRPNLETAADLQPLLDAIAVNTGLPIALEGIYRWIAFLPSRMDARVPVANRYFGVFSDGRIKVRGIAARRRDTAPFITAVQMEMLAHLARSTQQKQVWVVLDLLQQKVVDLRNGRIPLADLLVAQTLSREVEQYRVASASARAATQLARVGKPRRPGQRIRFIYTRGNPGVTAWDLPQTPSVAQVDVGQYITLLLRAAGSILQPFGVDATHLQSWLTSNVWQPPLPFPMRRESI